MGVSAWCPHTMLLPLSTDMIKVRIIVKVYNIPNDVKIHMLNIKERKKMIEKGFM